jgi:hypothetical protein
VAVDGPGLFENDASVTFAFEVAEAGQSAVERALACVLGAGGDELEVDDVAEAWLAAELVAAAAGQHVAAPGAPPELADAVAAVAPTPALVADAVRVVELIAVADSEFSAVMVDLSALETWRQQLAGLRSRLVRARPAV